MTTRPGYVYDAAANEWVAIGQAAVLAPIAYQASAPSSPATGDIWIDSDDEVPSVDSTLYYRWTKTMSGGETSISGTDDSYLALQYTPGYESVFINGVLQVRGLDYVASTGTTITGLIALAANDVVMIESIVAYSVGDTYTQSQTNSLLDAKSPVSTTGLVLISSTAIGSAVSFVTVNNAFSAAHNNYLIIMDGSTASAVGNFVFLTLNNSAGSTYNYSGNYHPYGGANVIDTGSSQARIYVAQSGADNTTGFNLVVSLPFATLKTTTTSQFATASYSGRYGGFDNNAVSHTGFTISITSGTLTGGTIKVYGYK